MFFVVFQFDAFYVGLLHFLLPLHYSAVNCTYLHNIERYFHVLLLLLLLFELQLSGSMSKNFSYSVLMSSGSFRQDCCLSYSALTILHIFLIVFYSGCTLIPCEDQITHTHTYVSRVLYSCNLGLSKFNPSLLAAVSIFFIRIALD